MHIKFHNKIYTKSIIQQATKDFKDLADFKISREDVYINVDATNIDPELSDIFYEEFTTYVLCLQKKKITS